MPRSPRTAREIARSAPARLIEEIYKLLRAGSSEKAFRMLAERRLLEPIAPELQKRAGEALWQSLAALDAYRQRFEETPETLTNAILLGSLLVPLGYDFEPPPVVPQARRKPREGTARSRSGMLPLARRDVERLRQILSLQRRLLDMHLSPRARKRADASRTVPRSADLAGDSRPARRRWSSTGAGSSRRRATFEGERRSGAERRAAGAPAATTPATVATIPSTTPRSRPCSYPCLRSNSRMNDTSASTPSSGNAL